MISEETVIKLLIIDKLIHRQEYVLRELAWEIGIQPGLLERIVNDMSKNYLISIEKGRIIWNPADNPSTLKPWGWLLIHKPLLGSTQEAAKGASPWSVIVAEYMLAGKGRHGKKWYSDLGGLWTTFKILTNSQTASMTPIIIPIILVRILRKSYGVEASIKWPNDIIVDNKKIAGILIEGEAFRDQILLYIGIGININNDPPLPDTISLKNILNKLTPRNRFLSLLIGWMSRMEKLSLEPEKIRENYMEYLETLNRKVLVKTLQGELVGKAVDVRDTGELIIEVEAGEKKVLDPTHTFELRHID
ncbi:biotin--[acetyl-CoA-carboxylase] ligase [Staphylothermus hellenicus]|uniref:Biotin/acetyl-CoA-carboxylase ligase n=1 Tax=Staphylothermus hellenicus (strain DSM 12710 / JCM 10830 / BK20S6-10-b1 / P8) TaxID=591019 RepID=D7D8G3_STAHD|nr:biotin--[acetyl-CoA-carboxylase] ligase [Staphylothermus hellenicus]ADI32059.1 biotin/acetyl-CoA-carboxylase ligase [Staphylothermus hellenicus DSM 12710]